MTKRLLFDIEANGFLAEATKVHCIWTIDLDTGEERGFEPHQISEGIRLLSTADVLVAHFGLSYDLRVLQKLHGFTPKDRVIDTVVASRLIHPDIKRHDADKKVLPAKLWGSHSLEAWGLRLGVPKTEYTGGWDAWSPVMHEYCRDDVRTNYALWKHLDVDNYPIIPLDLEHEVARICLMMEEAGWPFDWKAAGQLYTKLKARQDELEKALREKFGTWQEVDKVFTPKRDDKKRGYVKGVEVTKYKTVVFNPGSRVHIEKKLREAGWVPTSFTESGRAKLDEDILLKIQLPEAAMLVEYLLVQKRLGQLAEGDNAWLKVVGNDQRIHASYNPMGTNTGRATHYNPNISQVPANRAPYGKECRSLFTVPKGWKLVGADMAGLELRCLAHYMAHFDKGEYAKIVVDGDPHTYHQNLAELPTRDHAKTFIYALIYGAGDAKLGSIVGKNAYHGKKLRARFATRLSAYEKLLNGVKRAAGKGYINGLDGRRLYIRSQHSALNTLLQSAGAILCKTWLANIEQKLRSASLIHGWDGGDYVWCGWIHDEVQIAVREHLADKVGALIVEAAQEAGIRYGFKCRLDSQYVVGNSWSDTH